MSSHPSLNLGALPTSLTEQKDWRQRCQDLVDENARPCRFIGELGHLNNKWAEEDICKLRNRVSSLECESNEQEKRNLALSSYGARVMRENNELATELEELRAESTGFWLIAHANAHFATKKWQCRKQTGEVDGAYGWRPLGSKGHFREVENIDLYRCPICRERFEDGEDTMLLPCRHRFHEDCVRQWLQENLTCPKCTRKFKLKAHLTLFEPKNERLEEDDLGPGARAEDA